MSTVTIEVEEIEINVVCDTCGRDVDAVIWQGEICVGMCEHCLEEEKEND